MFGDWNDYLTAPNSSLLKLCTSLNLVDPWLYHSSDGNLATHERGTNRIDSILVSTNLMPTINTMGYSPVGMISSSDHRSVHISFFPDRLFGNQVAQVPSNHRVVRSNDKVSVTKFVEAMHSHLQENNVFNRARPLKEVNPESSHELCQLANAIDDMIGQAGDLGERRAKKRRPEWYSIALVNQRLTVSYIRHYV